MLSYKVVFNIVPVSCEFFISNEEVSVFLLHTSDCSSTENKGVSRELTVLAELVAGPRRHRGQVGRAHVKEMPGTYPFGTQRVALGHLVNLGIETMP